MNFRLQHIAAVAAVSIISAAGAALGCAGGAEAHGSLSAEVHPKSGLPGSTLTVTGQSRTPGGRINARWSKVGGKEKGSGMATADGLFSFRITVPVVPPGVYYLVVEAPQEPVARTAFEVTEPPPSKWLASFRKAATAHPAPAALLSFMVVVPGAWLLLARRRAPTHIVGSRHSRN